MSDYDFDPPVRETAIKHLTGIPAAIALLRISLGVMFVSHSVILKFFTYTLAGTADFFASIGLPVMLAYVVFWMEAIGGVLLILGVATRWVSLALLPILIGAVWTHSGFGWVFSNANGGWEYPLYLVVLAVAQAMLGDGAFALGRRPGASPRVAIAAG